MFRERLIYIQCFISIYANVMSLVGGKNEEVNFPTQKKVLKKTALKMESFVSRCTPNMHLLPHSDDIKMLA